MRFIDVKIGAVFCFLNGFGIAVLVFIILMVKIELVALLYLSSWCLVMVERLFLAVPWRCLRFVIVVFPDHTHFQFFLFIRIKQLGHQLYNHCTRLWPTKCYKFI